MHWAPPNADVFVFGPSLQLDPDGEIIPEEDQQFVWIQEILDKLNCVVNPLPNIPQPGWASPLHFTRKEHSTDGVIASNHLHTLNEGVKLV